MPGRSTGRVALGVVLVAGGVVLVAGGVGLVVGGLLAVAGGVVAVGGFASPGGAGNRRLQVAGPTMPSEVTPAAVWNRRVAAAVSSW